MATSKVKLLSLIAKQYLEVRAANAAPLNSPSLNEAQPAH